MENGTSTNGRSVYHVSLYQNESQAKRYFTHRPRYTQEFYNEIYNFLWPSDTDKGEAVMSERKGDVALDLACGSGQFTVPLAGRFRQVIGVDTSQEQIDEANADPTKPSNVSYRVGRGEDLSFQPDESVDLITVATAIHFFNLPQFYKEVKRVLRKGGVLVVTTYMTTEFKNPRLTQLIDDLYYNSPITPTWVIGKGESVKDIQLPFTEKKRVENLSIIEKGNVHRLVGHVDSWSASQAYKVKNPETDIFEKLQQQIVEILYEDGVEPGTPPSEIIIDLIYPATMQLGRK